MAKGGSTYIECDVALRHSSALISQNTSTRSTKQSFSGIYFIMSGVNLFGNLDVRAAKTGVNSICESGKEN